MTQRVPLLRFLNNSGDRLSGLDIFNMANGNKVASRNDIPNGQTVDFEFRAGRYHLVAHTLEGAELDNVNFNSTVVLDAHGQLFVVR